MLTQKQKRLKIAQPQTDRLRSSGLGAQHQQEPKTCGVAKGEIAGFVRLGTKTHCLPLAKMFNRKWVSRSAQKSQAMPMARHMRTALISAPTDLRVFCLLRRCPKPREQELVLCNAALRTAAAQFSNCCRKNGELHPGDYLSIVSRRMIQC